MSDNPTNSTVTTSHATTVSIFGATLPFDIYSATYAILVATGGVLGYVKAKSAPSLAAGLIFGAFLGTGSYLEATQDNYTMTFATSGLLGFVMGRRFLNSRKFMPAGLITAMSLGMVVRYSIRSYQLYQESSTPKP